MRRYGENIKRNINYKIRVGVYGVILIGNKILLTDQDKEEIQLPGGGVDPGEQKIQALLREIREETGWKINPDKYIGFYQRFVFMPEYHLWAHKICHIYYCRGIYPLSEPLDLSHTPIMVTAHSAFKLLHNEGDKVFLRRCLKSQLK